VARERCPLRSRSTRPPATSTTRASATSKPLSV
jgi:hypothetical protein